MHPGTTFAELFLRNLSIGAHRTEDAASMCVFDVYCPGGELARLNVRRLGRRTLAWAGLGVFVPLLPVICVYVIRLIRDGRPPGFFDVLSNGELLVIATVLAAASAAEPLSRLKADKKGPPGETPLLIGGIIVAVFGAAIYGIVAALGTEGHKDAAQHVTDVSHGSSSWPAILGIGGFIAALLVGAGTVFVGAWED